MNKTHASFFTGIRGFDVAAEQVGWQNVLHCEINGRLRKFSELLNPNASSYGDIKQSDFTIWRNRIFCLSGGFPCQPYSQAGLQLGTDDERHLWPEMLRAIREIQPPWVVGENVRGLVNWNGGLVFEQVQADLEAEGYEVQPVLLPAAGIGAPHERYRVWFITYSKEFRKLYDANATGEGYKERERYIRWEDKTEVGTRLEFWPERSMQDGFIAYSGSSKSQRSQFKRSFRKTKQTKKESGQLSRSVCATWEKFPTQSPVCDGDDGLRASALRTFIRNNSDGILTEKEIDQIVSKTLTAGNAEIIQGGGNAIVPGVALQIFKTIMEYETLINRP